MLRERERDQERDICVSMPVDGCVYPYMPSYMRVLYADICV